MRVVLWACRRRVENESNTFCNGFRYLPIGEDPGPCGQMHVFHAGFGVPPREKACTWPMDEIGVFEMELA